MHHSSMDTESVRARVVDTYQQGPDAVVALVVALLSELAAHLETVSARVAALEEENAALRAKLGTNSGNSSKPPSCDGPGAKEPWITQLRETAVAQATDDERAMAFILLKRWVEGRRD